MLLRAQGPATAQAAALPTTHFLQARGLGRSSASIPLVACARGVPLAVGRLSGKAVWRTVQRSGHVWIWQLD